MARLEKLALSNISIYILDSLWPLGIVHPDGLEMDGGVGATNCPIPPGKTYTYNFTTKGQEGNLP